MSNPSSEGAPPFWPTFSFTLICIALTGAYITDVHFSNGVIFPLRDNFSLSYSEALIRGQLWRLLSYACFHLNASHLAGNLFLFLLVGPPVERQLGVKSFLVIFVGSILAAGFIFLFFQATSQIGSSVPVVGASGGVFGLLGAYAVLWGRERTGILLILELRIRSALS